jgi:hypothetical protein
MATKEIYERGAANLANRARETSNPRMKGIILTHLGNLRYSQYINTHEARARRLAGNCYIAARSLSYRPAVN